MQILASISILNSAMPVVVRQTDYKVIAISLSAFVIVLIFLAVKLLFRNYFKHLFINVFRSDISAKNFSETNSSGIQASILTGIASTLSVGTAIMTLVEYFPGFSSTINIKPAVFLLATIGIAVLFVAFYRISLSFLGWVLNKDDVISQYSEMTSDIFRVMGIIIFPLFMVIPFSELWLQKVLIISVISVFIIAFIVRFYGFVNFLVKIKFFNHYAILYFCTFEILPVLFILNIIGNL